MFGEVKIDPPGPSGVDAAAIYKLISFLEVGDVTLFQAVGGVRRSGATRAQLETLLHVVEGKLASGRELRDAVDESVLEVALDEPKFLLSNGASLSPADLGSISVVNGFAQASEAIDHCFGNTSLGVLALGAAILRERRVASLYMAMRDAGIYYWYAKTVLAASEPVMSAFAAGVRAGLLSLDLGDQSVSGEQCSHLLNTLQVFSHANSMSNHATSSPVTELLFQYWLTEYSRGDVSLAQSWRHELSSTKALFTIHALEGERLALHSVLATKLKPQLVFHTRG